MAIIQSGVTTDLATVDPTLKTVRVSTWPREITGVYTGRATTGVLAAAMAVDANIVGLRNAVAATKDIYINRIEGSFGWVVAATAAQQFGVYMERFSGAFFTGGGTHTPMKGDTNHPTSQVGELRVATTSGLATNGATFDGNKVPLLGWTTVAIGTGVGPAIVFDVSEESPIRLRAGEGLALRNLVVWPAAGTGVLTARISWEER